MKKILFLFLALLFMNLSSFAQFTDLQNGVEREFARKRAGLYSGVKYKLDLTLEKMSPVLKGSFEVTVKLAQPADIVLDWRKIKGKEEFYSIKNASLNGKPIEAKEINEHLVIAGGIEGENTLSLNFTSPIAPSGAGITRYIDKEDGSEYIYSLFVPSDASTAFPCFDQPDLKAKFKLFVNAPKEWRVVSNGLPNMVWNSKGQEFFETEAISPYVFAFAAGDFKVFTENFLDKGLGGGSGTSDDAKQISIESRRQTGDYIYVRKSQAEKFKPHAAEIFRLNRESVKFFEEYFDYKFPFPKYDLVLIPEFPFGGMEHAGATFLRESSIIFPSEPTANDFISRANLIFHEAAHQWFGDLVTMKWFDDLWLKEGFATFAGYKAMEKIMPEYNAWKVFYERTKQAAYQTDSTKGTTPIYQEIPNLSAAKSAYGNIVYNKAPAFLRQAEFYLGEKEFQAAVRSFLKKHEFKNAAWQDLVSEFESASKQDLKQWASAWVTQRGMPRISTIKRDKRYYQKLGRPHDTRTDVYLKQSDILGGNSSWQMKTNVLIRFQSGVTRTKAVTLTSPETFAEGYWSLIANNTRANQYADLIFPNYGDYGYGTFLLDIRSKTFILGNIQNEKDDFLRAMMWGSLWDSVREAELAPKDYVELAIKNISVEKDVSTIQTILGRVSAAMNYYLSDAQARELSPKIEAMLIEKMQKAETPGQRITYYRAFLNNSASEKGQSTLKDILSGELAINGFTLKTKDKFDIATRLAILGDPDSAKLLEGLSKTETSDDAKRYSYAAGAAFGNKETKTKYFNDFLSNKDISESWIEAAFIPFNSIRHSEITQQYLEKALAELPNLKRNRKIFFVNGWLGAFIGGQKDEKALGIVNKFLADNPNLDKDLRLKILENIDIIERSVNIRKKYGAK